MHRSNVDRALSYTPQDLLLFKDSPFASWMERLSVDYPEHGIEPNWGHRPKKYEAMPGLEKHFNNTHSKPSSVTAVTWNEFVKNQLPKRPIENPHQGNTVDVVMLERSPSEALDASETLSAMHRGAQFVVNAQLVCAPLSCTVDMLIRSSGVSALGDYIYLPCITKADVNDNAALGLSFAADLLESIQGKLPPQMLAIPSGGEIITYKTQDHIYHYRAVKKRFLDAQGTFKRHLIPNPEDSSHFGRWSQCANDIMKRRALDKALSDEPVPNNEVGYARPDTPPKTVRVYVDSDLPEKNYANKNRRASAADAAVVDAAVVDAAVVDAAAADAA